MCLNNKWGVTNNMYLENEGATGNIFGKGKNMNANQVNNFPSIPLPKITKFLKFFVKERIWHILLCMQK